MAKSEFSNELKKSKLYSEELGIDLKSKSDNELFKWFLASILFGARISETLAKRTYRTFEKYDLIQPQKIIDAGFHFLIVPIMREGGYVRYDGRKSNQILMVCEKLLSDYSGSLNRLHDEAKDSRDLEERLAEFYGVGAVTINIFLRELRPFWEKANPEPMPIVFKLAKKYKIDIKKFVRKSITFTRLEAGLIRMKRH